MKYFTIFRFDFQISYLCENKDLFEIRFEIKCDLKFAFNLICNEAK